MAEPTAYYRLVSRPRTLQTFDRAVRTLDQRFRARGLGAVSSNAAFVALLELVGDDLARAVLEGQALAVIRRHDPRQLEYRGFHIPRRLWMRIRETSIQMGIPGQQIGRFLLLSQEDADRFVALGRWLERARVAARSTSHRGEPPPP